MGKKAKKKGGGKKKGGKKGSKKPVVEQMTPNEAILAYRISIIEQQIEDLKYEVKQEEDKREHNRERNTRLADERGYYIKKLMEQYRLSETKEQPPFVDKDEVTKAMKNNWQTEKDEHASLLKLYDELSSMDKVIASEEKELQFWREYAEKGHLEHKTQVNLLEQEIKDTIDNFKAMTEFLQQKLNKDKSDISTKAETDINDHKDHASDRAISILDKNSKQEVTDNEWLKHESKLHDAEMAISVRDVQELEKKNLSIMESLFDCKIEDLKVSKDIFLTQFADEENIEKESILEVDLNGLFSQRSTERPKSAMQEAMEKKYSDIMERLQELSEDSESDNDDNTTDLLPEMLTTERWNNCLNIGDLELKMLCVTGEKVSYHNKPILTKEEEEALVCNPERWPVTRTMLHDVSKK